MIKLTVVKTNPGWLEATWIDEVITEQVRQQEVDGEMVDTVEEVVTKTQVWCESFSGHPEHIQMLKIKASEFGTELTEYEDLIAEVSREYKMPTADELLANEVVNKVQEYKAYLSATDFKMTIDYFAELISEEQVALTIKRAEARKYIRENEVKA